MLKMYGGRFERMFAVPEQQYLQMNSLYQSANPQQQYFSSLSENYNKYGRIPDTQVRVQRQGEVLEEMKKMKDEMRDNIVSATPKPYRTRADSLFKFLQGRVIVNDKGEIHDQDGNVIEGSNITDLIQHAIRDRRRNFIPQGWSNFQQNLREANVPSMILNYNTLSEIHSPSKSMASTPVSPVVKSRASTPSSLQFSTARLTTERGRKRKRDKSRKEVTRGKEVTRLSKRTRRKSQRYDEYV